MPNASSRPTVMPITADAPTIATTAMLVVLSVSQWQARKHDKKVSDEVAHTHGTHIDAGRYHKVLLAKGALAAIVTAANKARDFHYKNTLPWLDNGARVLLSTNYMFYTEAMRALRVEFDAEVSKFVASYDGYVAQARIDLNGLFSETDYPNVRKIARRFDFGFDFMPLPTAGDFRVTLGDREQAKIRADIEKRTAAAIHAAVKDVWTRVSLTVGHMVEKLRAYNVVNIDGKARTEGAFRDTLVANVRDLVDLLPRLNLTNDPQLDAIAAEMRAKLCQHDAQDLRTDTNLRATVAQDAQAILDRMAAFMGEDAPDMSDFNNADQIAA